jgi:pimeloyl-ACP methyl ester carboxylesterase
MKACVDYGNRMAPDFTDTLFYPEDEIARCDAPVLWLGLGTDDEYTNAAEQVSMLLLCKAARAALHVIPHCPHGVTSSSPAWYSFCDMVGAWLVAASGTMEGQ